MGLELHDGRITGSSGIAKAGLTLGIIGTGLGVLGNNGNGLFGNGLFGGGSKDEQIAELKADKQNLMQLLTNLTQNK